MELERWCHGGSGVEGGGILGAEGGMKNSLDLRMAKDVRDVGEKEERRKDRVRR